MADVELKENEVVAQEGKLVGDENQPEPREPQVSVVDEAVDAQVAPPREADADKVNVHEVSVTVDEFVLDPSAPEAVIVPDAGRGSLDLPIHALTNPSPEAALESGEATEATVTAGAEPPSKDSRKND